MGVDRQNVRANAHAAARSSLMEKSSKRGKIPQSDWPLIMARYEAGETLASIARTYDCSPPAISYVVNRSRARHGDGEPTAKPLSLLEPQLIKGSTADAAPADAAPLFAAALAAAPPVASSAPRPAPVGIAVAPPGPRHDDHPARDDNGVDHRPSTERAVPAPSIAAPRPAAPPPRRPPAPVGAPPAANGDQRRTLHLSLGNPTHGNGADHGNRNGNGHVADGQPAERPPAANHAAPAELAPPASPKSARPPTTNRSGGMTAAATAPPTQRTARRHSSTRRCATGSTAISPHSCRRSMRHWLRIRKRAAPDCAKQPIGCCAPERARGSN